MNYLRVNIVLGLAALLFSAIHVSAENNLGTDVSPQVKELETKVINYNMMMVNRLKNNKPVSIPKYVKKISSFAKEAVRVSTEEALGLDNEGLKMTARISDCAGCNLGCTGAATICVAGCAFAGPFAPVCVGAWAITNFGCVGGCVAGACA